MNRRFHTNPFVTDPDEPEAENGLDSPSSGDDTKISSAPSPKKRLALFSFRVFFCFCFFVVGVFGKVTVKVRVLLMYCAQ